MNLSDFRGVILGLDRASEDITSEAAESSERPVKAAKPGFFFDGPKPRATGVEAAAGCAKHAGAVHSLPSDPLANALGQELGGWLSLARDSETARRALGMDRLADDGREASVGTMTSYPFRMGPGNVLEPAGKDRDFELYLAGSRDIVVPNRDGGPWASEGSRAAKSKTGAPIEPCPPPKLLGVFDEGELTRVPLGYTETWLSDGPTGGEWSDPCESCRAGLAGWACGHDEARAKLPTEVRARYAEQTKAWEEFLRGEGAANRKKLASTTRSQVPRGAPAAPGAIAADPVDPAAKAPVAALGKAALLGAAAAPAIARAATLDDPPGRDLGAKADETLWGGGAPASLLGGAPGDHAGPAAVATKGTARQAEPTVASKIGVVTPPAKPTAPTKQSTLGRWEMPEGKGPAAASGDKPLGGGDQEELPHVHVRIESTEFSCEDVQVRELRGNEGISRLFAFELLIVFPEEKELPIDSLVGASVSIVFDRGGMDVRGIHGMVSEVCDRLETESKWRSYRLWIAPRLWRASLVATQEVHVDISVPDLIKKKLALVGLDGDEDIEMRLRGTYPPRDLIVQYKETDVAFISRLAEHLGICFFFEHDGGTDKLVFSDENAGFRALSREKIPFRARGEKVDIFELEMRCRAFPANFVMQDYNYRIPTVDLTSTYDEASGLGGGVVEYGAHYKTPAEGVELARMRAQEQIAEHRYLNGKSDAVELVTGGRFELVDHPRLEPCEFLVVEVEHYTLQNVFLQGGGTEPYRNSFRMVDLRTPFRPLRRTPRPRIHGVLTALVEPDPSGAVAELAQIDAEGRYTVLFYFDATDVSSKTKHSHQVRMIQPHSGPHYGMHFPLKPGVEVLIVFMDGDPDRPLIVGSVPNPVTPSPVIEHVNLMNRIETASGLIIEMRDAVPPLAR